MPTAHGAGDENKPVIAKLVKAHPSPEVKDVLDTRFEGPVLPAW
ncbi:hypothetical protein [Ancylobacter lacus]|nr:hypothetical protein [Ancylobacter lacus]